VTLPNFLVIGTQKAGTRWMRNMLAQHPDVFMPSYEVHYFDRAANHARGRDWYESHFAAARGQAAIGEKTPSYLMMEKAEVDARPRRIHELLPDARLIAVLRNPVERAISAINHEIRVGRKPADADLDQSVRRAIRSRKALIRYGYYHQHLMAYHRFFDPSRLLVLIYEEDVVAEPRATLRRVCTFLGIDPEHQFHELERRVNPSGTSPFGRALARFLPLRPHTKARVVSRVESILGVKSEKRRPSPSAVNRLYAAYAEENARLFELLGRDIPSWTKGRAHIVT
jgi:hypothetical protein